MFYLFNTAYFSEVSFFNLLSFLFYGLRFDVSAIVVTNSLFIFLHLIPLPQRNSRGYQKMLAVLFYVINSIAILSNCADFVYFKFINKRSTADLFRLISAGTDFLNLLPTFIKDYWYILLIWLSLIVLMVYLYRKTLRQQASVIKYKLLDYVTQSILWIVSLGLSVIAFRGGAQLRPIMIINAAEYSTAKNIPLIINTPFSIITTIQAQGINESHYFSDNEVEKLYSPLHVYKKENKSFNKMNVVVIIMESFSKEYIGSLNNNEGYTPFLDSLISQSLVFDNAFANGKKSMEGIPAVVASIPAWMTEPFITSNYGSNRINSLASVLKKEGYKTSFFHGGVNGTMGFNSFAKLAGFDDYYGKNEYNNDADYDGNWGIWDEPFFQYFAKQLNQMQQPFFSAFFSLSSHHPFLVPEKYKSMFKDGPLEIDKSVRYSDYALRKFFETASKMPWFDNTLFIITADHTGISSDQVYSNRVGMYRIPIVFYKKDSDFKGVDHTLIQQIDIMPSILDYLNYNEPFFAYGESAFKNDKKRFTVNYIDGVYQILDSTYVLQFDGNKPMALYNYKKDNVLSQNKIDAEPVVSNHLESQLKATIQTYNSTMIHNKMVAE